MRKHIGTIIAIVFMLLFAYQLDGWCNGQIIKEGVQNKYNTSNDNLSTKVQTNSGNIQYLHGRVRKFEDIQQHVDKIQTNVDKLNDQMMSIQAKQTKRAHSAQKATSKPVTGLH